jgi:hypothetical protein
MLVANKQDSHSLINHFKFLIYTLATLASLPPATSDPSLLADLFAAERNSLVVVRDGLVADAPAPSALGDFFPYGLLVGVLTSPETTTTSLQVESPPSNAS